MTNNILEQIKSEVDSLDESYVFLTSDSTLIESKLMIDESKFDLSTSIEPPSIEPLRNFIDKRTTTIETLRQLRGRIEKHANHCKISNSLGNSASIIGGILCFACPPIGVPVLLAGSATTLGTNITENVIKQRLGNEYASILEEDSLAMKICESNLKDITKWLITVYSLSYSVSNAGVNFLQLSDAIHATTTLGNWRQVIGQLPSLGNVLTTGAQTAGTISGKILGVSVIISAADLIQTWLLKDATLTSIDKDIALLEQQMIELRNIADAYRS